MVQVGLDVLQVDALVTPFQRRATEDLMWNLTRPVLVLAVAVGRAMRRPPERQVQPVQLLARDARWVSGWVGERPNRSRGEHLNSHLASYLMGYGTRFSAARCATAEVRSLA